MSLSRGGCITRGWSQGLEVREDLLNLVTKAPSLMHKLELLHDSHGRRLPRVLGWSEAIETRMPLGKRVVAVMQTLCSSQRGLQSTCFLFHPRRRR